MIQFQLTNDHLEEQKWIKENNENKELGERFKINVVDKESVVLGRAINNMKEHIKEMKIFIDDVALTKHQRDKIARNIIYIENVVLELSQ